MADINAQNINGETSLHLASSAGKLEIVKSSFKNKPTLEIEDNSQNTPLLYAASSGHVDIVKYLLEMGSNINHKNNYNNTALILSAQKWTFASS